MEKETKRKLDDLMDRYEQALKRGTQIREKQEKEDDGFLAQFEQIRKSVIRPVMEDMGNALKTRGHDYDVSEADRFSESTGVGGRINLACKISMEIFSAGIDRVSYTSANTPLISFTASSSKKRVLIHASNMTPGREGRSGPHGELDMKEITREKVEVMILELIGEILDPKRPI